MRRLTSLLFAIFLLVPAAAQACNCFMMDTADSYDWSEVVFIGRVMDIAPSTTTVGDKVTFETTHFYKGAEQELVSVTVEAEAPDSCGYVFKPGEEYLVFANVFMGVLSTHQCSGTQPTATAVDALAELERLDYSDTSSNLAGAYDDEIK